MDIVHLIETKLIKSSVEEASSCTYAEIEQTVAPDHSDGKPARGGFQLVGESLPLTWLPHPHPRAPRQVSPPFAKTSAVPGLAGAPSPSPGRDQAGRYP